MAEQVNTMIEKLKNALVDDWKIAWKFWSVQLNAVGLVLMTVAEILRDSVGMVPPSLAHLLPHAQTLALGLFFLGLAARLIRQDKAS